MAESKSGSGPEEEPTQTRKKTAARKAAPAKKAAEPTPESIGIEGTVRVGGHRLDDDQGWVTEPDEPEEGD